MHNLDPTTAFSLIASLIYALLALVLIARRQHPVLLIMALLSSLGSAGLAAWLGTGWNMLPPVQAAPVLRAGVLLIGGCFLVLCRSALRSSDKGWLWGVPAGFFALAAVLGEANPFFYSSLAGSSIPVPAFYAASWASIVLGVGTAFDRSLRNPQPSVHINNARYWLLPAVLLLFGSGLLLLSQYLWGGALHLAGVCTAGLLALNPYLPDIRRMLARLALIVLAVGLYYGVLLLVQTVSQARPDLPVGVLWLIAALALVILLNPFLRRLYMSSTSQPLSDDHQDPTHIVKQFAQSICNLLEPKQLSQALSEVMERSLQVSHTALYLVDHEVNSDGKAQYRLRPVPASQQDRADGLLSEYNPLVERSRADCTPFLQAELQPHNAVFEQEGNERFWQINRGTVLWVPVWARSEWIGSIALGARAGGAAFDAQALELLSLIAAHAAVALENIRLVESLMRLNNDFRRSYTAMELANRHLVRLERTKTDFISIASHELRTPLTLISGANQMLLDEPGLRENPYYHELLAKISSGTDRLKEIVDSMLYMAQIDSHALRLDPQPVSIQLFIEGIRVEHQQALAERHLQFVTEGLEKLPPISADRAALHRVFSHLITNAIKYTPDGGEICVSGRVIEPDPGEMPHGGVEVIVQDTGIGIDLEHQQLIFGKFYQTGEISHHSTGKTKFKGGGPGLGLAIARGIIEAHGGKIWVESPGYDEETCPGSRFHVLLPKRQGVNTVGPGGKETTPGPSIRQTGRSSSKENAVISILETLRKQ